MFLGSELYYKTLSKLIIFSFKFCFKGLGGWPLLKIKIVHCLWQLYNLYIKIRISITMYFFNSKFLFIFLNLGFMKMILLFTLKL